MADPFELRIDTRGLEQALKRAPISIFFGLRKELQDHMSDFDAALQTQRLSGRPGLRRRTGGLAGSFNRQTTGDRIDNLRVRYGTNKEYAKIHQHGGTIRAKRSKYLTIPTYLNRTPTGTTRRDARSFPNVAFVRSRRGRLIMLAGDDPNDLRPMFILVKEVKVPARLGMFELWDKGKPALVSRMNRRISTVLQMEGFQTT